MTLVRRGNRKDDRVQDPGALRSSIFRGMTGRSGVDVSGRPGNVRAQLMTLGGPSAKTKSGIDLTAAANKLGLQRRTLERWVGGQQKPRATNAKTLATKAKQVASTKAGRSQVADQVRSRTSRGGRVSIKGWQGPGAKDYYRKRTTEVDLDPDQMEAMVGAWESGGDKGLMGWLTDHYDEEYLGDWGFDTVDEFGLSGKG